MKQTNNANHFRLMVAGGYLLIALLIGAIIYIWLGEWRDLETLEKENREINHFRKEMHDVYVRMVELSLLGETLLEWSDEEVDEYHRRRLAVDSMLCRFKNIYETGRIDSVRHLLKDKEARLHTIMNVLDEQEAINTKIARHVPIIARKSTQEKSKKPRRKGFLGLFGKKEEIPPNTTTTMLYTLNRDVIAQQKAQSQQLSEYADSLASRNTQLNHQLQKLILQIDEKVQGDMQQRETEITAMRGQSFLLIGGLTGVVILLLLFSYAIIQRDIRNRERSRRKLEECIRQNNALLEMRKNIILTISHDIRGPLGSINGSAELAMDIREKKKRNNHLANIQTACHHILHLVNNLLDIYRMNEWKETKNEIPFRPDRLIDRIATGYSCRSNDKGILFTSELSGLNVAVKGDADRIEQILDNLLENAVKFTENGEIRLAAAYENGHLTMEVRDTGIGMSEETLSRIFNPFERAAQKVNAEGFGLGLSITKGLVCLLDGEISVESTIGEGSTFRVVLPLVQIEWNADMENKNLSGRMLLPHRVLVIDDDAVQLAVIKEMLERNGVSCKTCGHVKELVRELRQQNADLILTDIQMPGTNGFNLLKLLRSSYIGNSLTVPVLAMTARGDTGNYDFAEAGFAGCINKPFSIQELLSSISSAVPLHDGQEDTVDFKRLTADTENKPKILELFVEEAERDMAEQQEALKTKDRKKLREVLHKMFPVWELLQIDQPLQAYRKLLHDEEADEEDIRQETEKIMAYTRELVLKAQNEIDGYGTENIDC